MIACSIDGELVAPEAATISIFDRGLLYGDGLFEVLRTWDGVAVELAAHLDRLYASAAALQLHVIERGRLVDAIRATLVAAGPGEHRIRIVVTRGPGAISARLAELGRGRAIVVVEPLPAQPVELALAIVDWPVPRRAGHKTLAYLDHVIARELAAAAGADEAVRLDAAGDVVEGATSNLFVVAGGAVTTPLAAAGALPGITRARVLACCAAAGVAAREQRLTVGELRAADEVFVTSALRGVVAVTRLDGAPRVAGPVTARLAEAYVHAMRQRV